MRHKVRIVSEAPFADDGAAPIPRTQSAMLQTECIGAEAMAVHRLAWSDLCRRALEPNVFLEPAFALPLIQHLAARRPPSLLLVWECDGDASFGRLVGLLPIHLPRRGGIVRGFRHKLVALGTPLLDRDRGEDAFAAMLAWLATPERGFVALALTDVTLDQPFHAVATRGAPSGIHVLGRRSRAILRRIDDGTVSLQSAKRRKELRRQRRRLAERGTRTYTSARSPAEVARATERFLALEHDGWKGRGGTALLNDAASATFTRTMTRLMAEAGQCRIDAAEIDEQAAAVGIVLTSGDHAFFWKTSFDERLATLSPGVQFALDLTEAQRSDPSIAVTDSCAIPDHPMIDRLWRDRMAVGDLLLALAPAGSPRFERAVRRERWRRSLQAWAKAFGGWWRDSRRR